MRIGSSIAIAAAVVIIAAAAYAVRGLQPSDAAVAEGKALTAAHNKMMTGMIGDAVVYSGDTDRDFVMLMVPHHQGAIDMAAVETKYGTDPTIRALTQAIAKGQQPEIDQMLAWQKAHVAARTIDADIVHAAFAAANDAMMNGMMGDSMAHSGNADVDFVKMMIPHHQGAIDMANVELKYGSDPQLRTLAQNIVAAQATEIAQMNGWLKAQGR
jgi:uncharacterized protein (DUF305 family)